jgi:hypothetical protein
MAKSYKEKQTTCSVCGSELGIGRHVEDGETMEVTDPCRNPLCEGTGTVTLVGNSKE